MCCRPRSRSEEGFIDQIAEAYRAIPLEVLVQGDSVPTHGITLEKPVVTAINQFSHSLPMVQWRWLDQNLTPMAALSIFFSCLNRN